MTDGGSRSLGGHSQSRDSHGFGYSLNLVATCTLSINDIRPVQHRRGNHNSTPNFPDNLHDVDNNKDNNDDDNDDDNDER